MPLFSETEDKIFGDLISDILENTNITRSSPGSKMRALVEAQSNKMGSMWRSFDLNVGQAFIDGARGQYLDFIGDMLGVPRLGEEPASISSLDRNIRFYVDSGTFGDINGASSIVIPSGTIVSTGPAASGTTYRVVASTILNASDSEAFVGVQSISSGRSVNVGASSLRYHNFSDYADSAADSLKVENRGDIVAGQDIESNANYRYRITNQLLNLEKANATAVRLAALAVPGVADVIVIPFHRGIGTYDVLIQSVTPTASTELIDAVQVAIEHISAQGVVPTSRGPVELGLSMVGTLTLRNTISSEEQTQLINSVTSNVTDYINDLDIAEDFIVNEAVERVMATSSLIKNIGVANKPFDSLFIYTPSELEDNKVRSTLIGDYSPEEDERIIVENVYAGTTPILFRIAS